MTTRMQNFIEKVVLIILAINKWTCCSTCEYFCGSVGRERCLVNCV